MHLQSLLEKAKRRKDYDYMLERVNYYNKLTSPTPVSNAAPTLSEHTYKNRKGHTVYFFDTYRYTRWFAPSFRWQYQPGDVIQIPPEPTILKSRPIKGENQNSVLLNLNKVRHFIFLKDKIRLQDKMDKVIFRGKVGKKSQRMRFMEMYFNHPLCDLGNISKGATVQWKSPKKTIYEHLEYKFIMALEGNDVASNLKWIMSSNSVAVMPRPTYETWFMEGTLIPNYHYVEIKADFSDLEERVNYYIQNPEELQQIVDHAHEYVEQFKNKKREKLISLLVLDKYFQLTQ